jgi:hypothetical protein
MISIAHITTSWSGIHCPVKKKEKKRENCVRLDNQSLLSCSKNVHIQRSQLTNVIDDEWQLFLQATTVLVVGMDGKT